MVEVDAFVDDGDGTARLTGTPDPGTGGAYNLQFTAINGRNIPRELYRPGENFSTTISTSCTMVAMVAIKRMKDRKLRL